MPNTPLMSGFGMAGVSLSKSAQPGDEALTMKLFSAGGKAIVVDESKLDAITAVSGSGPAYVFYLAEAMEKAARDLGLGEDANLLVRQTILGAANLLVDSNEPPAELRRKVTSPGGTTEAAIKHLDGNKSTDVVINAIKAAEKRSKELGQ
jgi:pyrroline-5-carboxylate reductase